MPTIQQIVRDHLRNRGIYQALDIIRRIPDEADRITEAQKIFREPVRAIAAGVINEAILAARAGPLLEQRRMGFEWEAPYIPRAADLDDGDYETRVDVHIIDPATGLDVWRAIIRDSHAPLTPEDISNLIAEYLKNWKDEYKWEVIPPVLEYNIAYVIQGGG